MNTRSYLVMALLMAVGLRKPFLRHGTKSEKTLTIVVGSAAGGSYDASARLLARHLGKYLPGHPSIVVKNLPGACSMTAVRSLDVPAAKDGSTIVAFQSGLIGQSRAEPGRGALRSPEICMDRNYDRRPRGMLCLAKAWHRVDR